MCGITDGSLTLLLDYDNVWQSDCHQLEGTKRKIKFGRDEQVCHAQKQSHSVRKQCNSAPVLTTMLQQLSRWQWNVQKVVNETSDDDRDNSQQNFNVQEKMSIDRRRRIDSQYGTEECRTRTIISVCGNKMPTRCNRGFYCRS